MVSENLRPGLAHLLVGLLGIVSGLGCEPTFSDRNSEVLERRILAIQVTPAQARPGVEVQLRALVVEPSGTLRNLALDWAFCNAPKPIAETNDVSAECLAASGEQFDQLGRKAVVEAKLPADGCRLFGPDVPPSMSGQPPGRPSDPDGTGSYYQPLRAIASNLHEPIVALGQASLLCGSPNLSGDQLLDYQRRQRVNEHPAITGVLVDGDESKPLSEDDGATTPLSVSPGQQLALRVTWPACPSEAACGDGICSSDEKAADCPEDCMTPKGCAGAEAFVYYDPLTRQVVERREAMRVSWFSGSGSFQDDHTGRREDEMQTFSDGLWTAPQTLGMAHLWVVLRDNRGGTSWQSYVVDVE